MPWEEPPGELTLSSGEVHVWRAALDRPGRVRELLWTKLSEDERDRAQRILPTLARERWSVARALLRVILGRYLAVSPEEVALSSGDTDRKPSLRAKSGVAPLSFNLSHSGDIALFAVAAGRVGVDVERIRNVDAKRIAGRLFSAAEQSALQELPEIDRRRAFFAAWTRKEACAKAVGEGLAAFAGFTVSVATGEQGELVQDLGDGLSGGPWCLWDLTPKSGYAAAVAAEGGGLALRCFDLTREEKMLLRGSLPRLAGD